MGRKTIEDYLYIAGIGLVPLFAAAVWLWRRMPHVPCLFHVLTGYYCPGCGGTRAVKMLLHGRLFWSIYYHPAVPYGAALYLGFMASQTVERLAGRRLPIGMRYRDIYVWLMLAILGANFLLKNYLHFRYGFVL